MKFIFYISILLMLTIFSTTKVNGQTHQNLPNNYVVLNKKVPQLKPILITAKKLKEEDGENFGKFEIIFCGKEIADITDPSKIEKFIHEADRLGVQLVACGFSLNKFKVDHTSVPAGIKIVENGILYNFQLQKMGFLSLSL
ncbi:sulfur reduction protein DsrE [Gramella sp. MT6]|uniref:DsrE family protein n=1 Tax=Gramella sp. MT6 TaxID=2705471 RepID=UPI001C5E614A|nr:sulfur reduction protein DsrE [Gramella sp. MT6]QYA26925.1 sulfur reduction protein DsrE [Gramella sp. MT6]